MQEEIVELPGIPVNATPLIRELIAQNWRMALAAASGWLGAHTSLSPEFLNSWQGDTVKVVTALSMLVLSSYLSRRKLKKTAEIRGKLAQTVKEKSETIEILKEAVAKQ